MPKKSKKSTQLKAEQEPQVVKESTEPATGTTQPIPSEETEEQIDQEAEHRLQNESPAPAEDGEAELEAQAEDTAEDALAEEPPEPAEDETEADEAAGGLTIESLDDDEEEFTPAPRPPAKLERLQKILSQAGVASRRHAEELITGGRVQVNGKIVTELGTKADAGRDHIRVDGKLLQGAERLRYFVLNKPRGYVTTVSDPERRPTVMEFFSKMSERLYPVGRLDYLSEGLLLVTNDGDLANKLTKASTGVQKTYLVKVSGQPTEEELDKLRGGVSIERGKPGEGRVRTAPAAVRQVRQGDNPWYEVVLIEGRNRELRKMFEEIGHFVEKIRRVGYGPLVLDQEPGHMRELAAEELAALRLAAEGKWKAPKAKAAGRRDNAERGKLPTVLPAPTRRAQPREDRSGSREAPRPFPARKPLGGEDGGEQPQTYRPARAPREGTRPEGRGRTGTGGYGAGRPAPGKFAPRTGKAGTTGGSRFGQTPPAWKKEDRGERPPARLAAGAEDRRGGYRSGPSTGRPSSGESQRTGAGRTGGAGSRTFGSKTTGPQPTWDAVRGGDRQRPGQRGPETGGFDRPGAGTRSGTAGSGRPRTGTPRTGPARTGSGRTGPARTGQFRSEDSRTERPKFERSGGPRPGGFSRSGPRTSGPRTSGPARPPRAEGTERPFPAGSARPGGVPAKSSSRPYGGARSDSRGATRAGSPGKTGWKPKPSSDGKRKPAFGTGSRPAAKGGSRGSRSQSGPRPGGKGPGGKRS